MPLDVNAIFDRICQVKGFKTDADLARFLEKSPQSVNQHRKNNSFDLKTLVEQFGDLDLDFILTGRQRSGAIRFESCMEYLFSLGYRVTLESKD